MDFITSTAADINWWAVILATLSTLPVGYLWYDLKMGFGKRWAKLNNLSIDELNKTEGMAQIFAVMLTTSFITAFLISCLLSAAGVSGFGESVLFGLIVGLVLRGGAHFIHNGFTRKPLVLTLIDAGHDLVSLTVMTVILGLWT